MRLLIAGGGTGGHLFPGIAVAEEFLARDSGNEVLFVGTERGIEARLLPRLGYRLLTITASGVKGQSPFAKLRSIWQLFYGYAQSRRIIKEFCPDVVFGVGGYASAPVVLAARGLQVRRFIHEQNAIPGLSNKLLARFAEKVFISIEEARTYFPADKTFLTGNPLRKEILADVPSGQDVPREGEKLRLLVFGGSAGAHRINTAMIEALPYLDGLKDRLIITHQTGENDLPEVMKAYEEAGFTAEVAAFIDNMAAAYSGTDLIVCRAGATTISEIAACGKAALFIPYPYAADDHQRRNAEALLKTGAGYMILEQELTGESLAAQLKNLMSNPGQIEATGRNARAMARLDAAQVIVDEMTKELQQAEGKGKIN